LNLPAPHRIARLHYLPRTAAFAVTWLGSLALYRDGVIGARHLLYGVVALLVYPQLVHLYACLAQDKKRAAQRNLYLDAFVLATWVAVSAFNFGVFYGLFASVCLNHALNGGLRSVLRAMVAFAAGIVAALMVVDVRFEPASSAVTAYVALGVLFIYIMGVAALFRAQNAQLVRVMKDVERKQEVFQALASAGAAAAEARTLEELVATTLDHLMRVLPKGPGLGLLVRAPQRPRVVHHVAFRGVPQAEQDWLLAHCIEHPLDTIGALPPGDCARYIIEPVGAGTPQSETLFVLRDDAVVGPLQRETIALFLQQYSSALENYWLTRSLTELANTDRLTGLANRGRLDARLAQLVAQKHTRANDDFSVIVADLNGLKHVNDTHGHALGDRLIAATAQALQRTCRETDVVARMGGDEFVVLCQATTSDEAAVLVARLRAAVAELAVRTDDGETLRVSMSLGWADTRECDPEQVMRLADSRMYADKQAHYRRRADAGAGRGAADALR